MTCLIDLAVISSGKRPSSVIKTANEKFFVPVVGGGGVSGFTSAALCEDGAIVTGRVGTLGQLHVIDGPCWPSDNALVIRPREGVDANYLRYALAQTIGEAAGLNRGAANPLITQRDLGQLRMPDIPHAGQVEIGGVLRSLDDKIELNQRTNETLEAMAQAIFRDWFIDFGPARRKMLGATDPIAIMGGLAPDSARAADLAALFPDAFDGELPMGWGYRNFGDLLATSKGGEWGSEAWSQACPVRTRVIRGTDFGGLEAGLVGKVPTRFLSEKKAAPRLLAPGDIVLEASGGSPTQPTGRSLLITESILTRLGGVAVPTSFCRFLRPASVPEGALAFEHLRALYASGGTWEYQNQSTGIANFQTTHFLASELVVWPGDKAAEVFAALVRPMRTKMASNESMVLAQTRDYLLPRLMSGQVSIRGSV